MPLESVDIWLQDEARFGQQNTTTRLWAIKGTRPDAIRQQQYEYAYLFGAVCPSRGIGEAFISPYANKDVMRIHLEQISMATETGRHALILMDGAGFHVESLEEEFSNISILKIPPYSPELNPIEQVWSWLRQHYLANQSFADYNEIVDKLSFAWNQLMALPEKVKSICSRDWLNLII